MFLALKRGSMSDPKLIRSVWLTHEQRAEILTHVETCCQRSNLKEINELLVELQNLELKKLSHSILVKNFVKGLKMPKDALPVSICTEAVMQMLEHVNIDKNLLFILCPLYNSGKQNG